MYSYMFMYERQAKRTALRMIIGVILAARDSGDPMLLADFTLILSGENTAVC